MTKAANLISILKTELKSAHMTYSDLVQAGHGRDSVKHMLAMGDMPLSRIDAICCTLKTDFAELAQHVADSQPLLAELTLGRRRR